MEYQQSSESLLGFNFNDVAQSYLRGSAKWEKFMAWVNIILLSIAILCCFFGGPLLSSFYSSRAYTSEFAGSSAFTFVFIFYGIIFGVVLVPNFYRLMFANKCIKALDNKDEELLTESLKNLKTYSTFWGILTIIFLAFYLLMFMFMLIGLSAFS